MIQEEYWLSRLAEASHLQTESAELLWSAFCTQLEQRLLAGSSLYIPQLGVWELLEHREQIAHTADDKYWLVPPRLTLGIQSEADRTPRSVSILLLAELLTQQTQLTPSAVTAWLEQIGSLTRELLQSGASVSWPRLGTLTPRTVEGQGCIGFDFLPQASFLRQLNKPFSMFAPVEVSAETISPELSLSEYADLEALYPLTTLWVPFAPTVTPSAQSTTEPTPPLEEEAPTAPTAVVDIVSPSEEGVTAIEEDVATSTETSEEEIPLPSVAPQEEATTEVLAVAKETAEPTSTPAPSKDEQPNLLFWIILGVGILVGLGALYALLTLTAPAKKPIAPAPTPSDSLPATRPQPIDSLALPADSLTTEVDSLQLKVAPSTASPTAHSQHPRANSTEQVRLHAGDRLSRLALKKYGHKAFWVYIYEENRDKLRDPDNIPVGVVITLPPASKYRIDAQDTNSVAKALLLQRQLQK